MKANKHITPALVFSLLVVCMSIFSQEHPEKKVLFRSEKLTLSNFFVEIAPGTNFSQLNGQMANVGILSGGFILNDKFAISFFSANSPKLNLLRVPELGSEEYADWMDAGVELDKLPSSAELVFVNFRHSGLRFDYLHRTDRILFWRAGLSAGFLGGLTLSENNTFLGLFNNTIYDESVISITPEIGLGINLLNWWRVYLDAGYRLLAADTRIISAADADSFAFSLSFGFGKF